MKQDCGGEKVPKALLAQTNYSQESLFCSLCLFYPLSPTDPSQGRLNFLFFLNIFFFFTCYFRGSLQRENKQQEAGNPRGGSAAVFPADEGPRILLRRGQWRAGRAGVGQGELPS